MTILSIAVRGLLAFLGSLAGQLVARRTAHEQERWRKREETMRLLRWAADHAVGRETQQTELGVGSLTALISSPLLDREDVDFVLSVIVAARASDAYTDDEGGTS